MASYSSCPTVVRPGECAYWQNCGNAGGVTCPARAHGTSDVIVIHIYNGRDRLPKLARALSLAELKAKLSREAGQYWAWVERTLPPSA